MDTTEVNSYKDVSFVWVATLVWPGRKSVMLGCHGSSIFLTKWAKAYMVDQFGAKKPDTKDGCVVDAKLKQKISIQSVEIVG